MPCEAGQTPNCTLRFDRDSLGLQVLVPGTGLDRVDTDKLDDKV